MKTLSFVAAILISTTTTSAQNNGGAELGFGYALGLPGGSLNEHTGALHGINLRAAYIVPKTEGRLSAGLEVGSGMYASFTRDQLFSFNGAPPTLVPVTYSSKVSSLNAGVRYEAVRIGGVGLFAGIKAGGTKFKSGFVIEDPEDEDGCKALESEKLARDFAFQGGAEAGINVDLSMFAKSLPKNQVLIQFRMGILRGGAVDYINVNHTEDAAQHHHHQSATDGGTPVNVRFVNVGTGQEHIHEVARMHTSPVNYLESGVSVIVRLD